MLELTSLDLTAIYGLTLAYIVARYLLPQREVGDDGGTMWLLIRRNLLTLLLCLLFTIFFLSLSWFIGLVALTVLHTLIDAVITRVQKRWKDFAFQFTIVEPMIHLIAIFTLWIVVRTIRPSLGIAFHPRLDMALINRALLYASGYIFVLEGGTEIVRGVLRPLQTAVRGEVTAAPKSISPEELGTGKIIGNLERFLILTLVILQEYTAIAFVLTAKSVARFRELDKREFAEYYLIGTLTSTLVAIIVGLLLSVLPTTI
ncbi:MAG TPA: hypothetical protein DCP08_06785 [Chloroflexi bacterium]|nr:hypothetical protein [Chloroflexota bacterium]